MTKLAQDVKAESKRQLLESIQECLAPVPLYLNVVFDFAALGDARGVHYAMSKLVASVRAAAESNRDLAHLHASEKGGE